MVLAVDRHEGGIALITLSPEAAKNTFTKSNFDVFKKTIENLMEDVTCSSIILTGNGKFFSAGGPINEFADAIDSGEISQMIGEMTASLHSLLIKIRTSSTVFIAAINGAAAGGGLGLALAMDYRISSFKAKFAASFFSLGLSPDGGTTWLLPRLVGPQKAKKFFFNNEIWNSQLALDNGVIDEICDEEEIISRSLEIAKQWGKWAFLSRRSTKQLLDASTSTFFETQLEFERALILSASLTDDFAEGVSAFMEKREPDFNHIEEE